MSGKPFSEREEEANRFLRALSEHPPDDSSGSLPKLPRYELRNAVGEGATAIVYRAFDVELKRMVALKLLRPRAVVSDIARQRFRREAETAAALSHPNLIAVYDAGEAERWPYLVMELIEGRPLNELLQAKSLSEPEAVRLVEEAARGVAAAHARGIVHRDLKPGNILVTSEGRPKVGDFGLAHLMDATAALTRTGTMLGTPLYMAPEQVEGRSQDLTPRTDVYALGAILYEALLGTLPHPGETLPDIYRSIAQDEPVQPRRIRPGLSVELETIVLKALDKDPSRRYPTALEFAEDLGRYRSGEPIQARPVGSLGRLWRKVRRNRAGLSSLAAAILVGLLVGMWASGRGRPDAVARIEQLEGTVYLTGASSKTFARAGLDIASGQGLETGDAPSRVHVSFRDGTRLVLGPRTSIQGLTREAPRSSSEGAHGKHVFLASGSLSADVPPQSDALPMIFLTSHGEGRASEGALKLIADPEWTRLDVQRGAARLTRSSDRKALELSAGNFAVASPDAPFTALASEAGNVIRVGKGKDHARPSQAAAAARDGATVEIDAGLYAGDAAVWTAHRLTLRGVGGRARLEARGAHVLGKGIWVIKGNDVTVEDVDFFGAAVPENNGAAIRTEGRGLVIRRCSFRECQNGLMGGASDSDLLIESSEFAGGSGNDVSHNINFSGRSLTVKFCYIHHARIGNQIKSYAQKNYLLYNRIMDELTGNSSYLIEMPQGGQAFVIGNVFQKSSIAENRELLSFGVEELYVVNNTFVSERDGAIFIRVRGEPRSVRVLNNIFAGPGNPLSGKGELSSNLSVPDPATLLISVLNLEYQLKKGAKAIDLGIAPGEVQGFDLTPRFQYVHPVGQEPRPVVGALDIGAFEHE